jgi:hypothetical protein
VVQYNETMGLFARLVAPLAATAWVVVAAGCSPFGGGEFACAQDDQCSGGPSGGRCEADGRCSFPDSMCASGRIYGEFAGAKSNTCVGGGDVIDAPPDGSIDGPLARPFCDAADTTLVACWEFEGNGIDGSGSNPSNTADTSTGAFSIGKVGMGLTLTTTSLITTGDRASLEPPNLTVEAWIRPTMLPATGRMGVIDSGSAYGIFLNPTGLLCVMGLSIQVTFAFPLNAWTHIACSADGTTTNVYIDGAQVATATGGAPLGVGDTIGTVLAGNSPSGEQLIGTIDQMRMWNAARTPAQICKAAGHTTCP